MPGIDGLELANSMINKYQWPASKIIILTSSDAPDLMEKCNSLGIDNYILKPVKPEMLFNTIKSICIDIQDINNTKLPAPIKPGENHIT